MHLSLWADYIKCIEWMKQNKSKKSNAWSVNSEFMESNIYRKTVKKPIAATFLLVDVNSPYPDHPTYTEFSWVTGLLSK